MTNILKKAKDNNCKILIDTLTYDPIEKSLSFEGRQLTLEPRSIELLELLLQNIGKPISADMIICKIWETKYVSKNVLTNKIGGLRNTFKPYISLSDVTKVIVTYPRKGYFINESSVQLTDIPVLPTIQEDTSNVSNIPRNRKDLSKTSQIMAFITMLVILFLPLIQESAAKKGPQPTRSQLLYQPVELLLYRLDAYGKTAPYFATVTKAILLQQQMEYLYTDTSNLDAPTYFIEPIDNSPYFPGAKSVLTSDFKLIIELKDSDTAEYIIVTTKLIHPTSDKVAYRGIYKINTSQIQTGLAEISSDLASFFNLPQPEKSNWVITENIVDKINKHKLHTLSLESIDEFTAVNIARELAQQEKDRTKLVNFVNRTLNKFKVLPNELKLWLGILSFKSNNINHAKRLLTSPNGESLIQNALIYTLVSYIAHQQNKDEQFRLNYMESLVALLRVIPSKEMFSTLSKPGSEMMCLEPWNKVMKEVHKNELSESWKLLLNRYCKDISEEFPTAT